MQKVTNDSLDAPTRLVACFPEDSKHYFHSGKLNFVVGHPWDSWQESPRPAVAVQLLACTSSNNHEWII
ncbi:MAG: hypothetical protein ACTSWW_12185, partial [Promethearchaeota archaeon]